MVFVCLCYLLYVYGVGKKWYINIVTSYLQHLIRNNHYIEICTFYIVLLCYTNVIIITTITYHTINNHHNHTTLTHLYYCPITCNQLTNHFSSKYGVAATSCAASNGHQPDRRHNHHQHHQHADVPPQWVRQCCC